MATGLRMRALQSRPGAWMLAGPYASLGTRAMCLSLVLAAFLIASQADAETFTVSGNLYDFLLNANSINMALRAAHDGDRILVKSGVYYESLIIDKRVSVIGVDAGKGKPVIDAGNSGSGITIRADGVRLEGFSIINSGSSRFDDSGIRVLSNDSYIRGNTISNCSTGIYIGNFSNNIVAGNTATYDDVGFFLDSAFNSTLRANIASNNRLFGFYAEGAFKNTLDSNRASKNKYSAVYMNSSNQNILKDNIDTDSDYYSMLLLNSSKNTIKGCKIIDTSFSAIGLELSDDNVISDCNISEGQDGIYLGESSDGNTIKQNILHNNSCGLYIEDSRINKIYLNSFIDNNESAQIVNCSGNLWNSSVPLAYQYNGSSFMGYLGNFWSNYPTSGDSHDGVDRIPYIAEGVIDRHPLAFPARMFEVDYVQESKPKSLLQRSSL